MQAPTATIATLLVLLVAGPAPVAAGEVDYKDNPLSKVLELLSSLESKIIKEGEAEQKAYEEYVAWCDDAARNKKFELKTALGKKETLAATIEKASSCIEDTSSKIVELGGAIAEGEGQLKDATLVREKENADFAAAEKELVDAVDVLNRAIAILEREAAKNPALMQVDTSNAKRLVQSMGAVISAAALSSTDRAKLMSLVQSQRSSDDEQAEEASDAAALGAPDPAAYKSHSSTIVEVLEDMLEKAKTELSDLRKAETSAQHNFDMLKQSLVDQKAADEKDLADNKAAKLNCEQTKAIAEGDTAENDKDIEDARKVLGTAQDTCMQVAADHEATMSSRAEELKAIAEAKKILKTTTPGAEGQTYSLLQVVAVSGLKTRADLANLEVINLIKRLAKEHHSAALSQLASKISAVVKFGNTAGEDPFVKVRELIQDLISRLMKEAEAEAGEKAYCDSEMAKSEAKKSDLQDSIASLSSKIDRSSSKSVELKAEVKELQAELAALAREQAKMDKIRSEQKEAYVAAKADLELGLEGVRKALTVLRSYYGGASMLQDEGQFGAFMHQPPLPEKHEKAGGAGGSIIEILEVVEADFAKELSMTETEESDAAAEYEKMTQENKITKALKEQDVKYKTQEFKSLDKQVNDLNTDLDTEQTELAAVMDYYGKLQERCIAKPETYEERKRRREAEIAGLKEALQILENETAFMQGTARAHPGSGLRR